MIQHKIKKLSLIMSSLTLWMTSCVSVPEDPLPFDMSAGFDLFCYSGKDCSQGQRCLANRCVEVSNASMPVLLKLSYPQAMQAPVFIESQFESGKPLGDFVKPDFIQSSVSVGYRNSYVSGVAVFTRQGLGAKANESQQSVDLAEHERSSERSTLLLLPGRYDLTIYPTSRSEQEGYPTMHFRDIEISAPNAHLHFDLDHNNKVSIGAMKPMDVLDYYIPKVTASILSSGLSNVQIRIQDQNSPAASASMELCKEGCLSSFELLMPPQRRDVKLNYDVFAHSQASQGLSIVEKLGSFTSQRNGNKDGSFDFLESYHLTPYRVESVLGRVVSEQGASTENAKVSIIAESADGKIKWQSSAEELTNMEGLFMIDVPVFEAQAKVNLQAFVHFEAGNSHASAQYDIIDYDVTTELKFVAKNKRSYKGQVLAGHKALEGARIIAKPSSAYGNFEKIESLSSRSGEFNLELDQSAYQVTIVPPARSGLPSYSFETSYEQAYNPFQVNLGKPELIYGKCLGDEAKGIENVLAEVFVMNEKEQWRQVALSKSDKNGTFRLFVPSQKKENSVALY